MNLRDYLKAEGLTQEAFAKKLSPPVSQGKVNHWLSGSRRVSLAEALQIEQITGGKVTLRDMVAMRNPCVMQQPHAEAA